MQKKVLSTLGKNSNATKVYKSNPFEPKGWKKQWEKIESMRESNEAPVDTMGWDELGDKSADKNVNIPSYFFIDICISDTNCTNVE